MSVTIPCTAKESFTLNEETTFSVITIWFKTKETISWIIDSLMEISMENIFNDEWQVSRSKELRELNTYLKNEVEKAILQDLYNVWKIELTFKLHALQQEIEVQISNHISPAN